MTKTRQGTLPNIRRASRQLAAVGETRIAKLHRSSINEGSYNTGATYYGHTASYAFRSFLLGTNHSAEITEAAYVMARYNLKRAYRNLAQNMGTYTAADCRAIQGGDITELEEVTETLRGLIPEEAI